MEVHRQGVGEPVGEENSRCPFALVKDHSSAMSYVWSFRTISSLPLQVIKRNSRVIFHSAINDGCPDGTDKQSLILPAVNCTVGSNNEGETGLDVSAANSADISAFVIDMFLPWVNLQWLNSFRNDIYFLIFCLYTCAYISLL